MVRALTVAALLGTAGLCGGIALRPDPGFSSITLSPGFLFEFKIDVPAAAFVARTTVPAGTRWFGVGIGEEGGGAMAGADVALVTADPDAASGWTVRDSYSLSEATPLPDVQQDWAVVSALPAPGGGAVVTLSRPLDTGDAAQDRRIDLEQAAEAPQLMIFARGESAAPSYHGRDHRFRRKVLLAPAGSADPLAELAAAAAEGIDVLNPGVAVPAETTHYEDVDFDVAEVGLAGKTIIGMSGVLDPTTGPLVHHFTVHGITADGGDELLYAWGPGSTAQLLPSGVGIVADTYVTLRIQTHFDNPAHLAGLTDRSGVRFWVAEDGYVPEHELGVLQLGDPTVSLLVQTLVAPMPAGLSQYEFACDTFAPTEPITIISHGLHMHQAGARMYTQHFRGGELIGGAEIEHFDFAYQDSVYRNAVAVAGDTFRTTCIYDAPAGTRFGLGSDEEMCIDFISYYPRQALPPGLGGQSCGLNTAGGALVSPAAGEPVESVGRSFGDPASETAGPDFIGGLRIAGTAATDPDGSGDDGTLGGGGADDDVFGLGAGDVDDADDAPSSGAASRAGTTVFALATAPLAAAAAVLLA